MMAHHNSKSAVCPIQYDDMFKSPKWDPHICFVMWIINFNISEELLHFNRKNILYQFSALQFIKIQNSTHPITSTPPRHPNPNI